MDLPDDVSDAGTVDTLILPVVDEIPFVATGDMRLNFDILFLIAEQVATDKSSKRLGNLLAICETCRALDEFATPLLLKKLEIYDWWPCHELLKYLRSHPERGSLIEELIIHDANFIGSVEHYLLKLLSHANAIRHLSIIGYLQPDPYHHFPPGEEEVQSLLSKMASLSSLQSFSVQEKKWSGEYSTVIGCLPSNLKTLHLEMGRYYPVTPLAWFRLTRFVALEELSLTCSGDWIHPGLPMRRPDEMIFPHVHTLTWHASLLETSTLMSIFPNLQCLSVIPQIYSGSNETTNEEWRRGLPGDQGRWRNHNREDMTHAPPGQLWTKLERLRGTVHELYMLGLSCHVKKLEIKMPDPFTLAAADRLGNVLRDVRPEHLELAFGDSAAEYLDFIVGSRIFDSNRLKLVEVIVNATSTADASTLSTANDLICALGNIDTYLGRAVVRYIKVNINVARNTESGMPEESHSPLTTMIDNFVHQLQSTMPSRMLTTSVDEEGVRISLE